MCMVCTYVVIIYIHRTYVLPAALNISLVAQVTFVEGAIQVGALLYENITRRTVNKYCSYEFIVSKIQKH